MTYETITLSIADNIATLTLNRPDRMNAFTEQMAREMIAAFDATDAGDDVRVVIVTGAGRAFCAGADLGAGGATFDYEKRLAARGVEEAFDESRVRDAQRVFLRDRNFDLNPPLRWKVYGDAYEIAI